MTEVPAPDVDADCGEAEVRVAQVAPGERDDLRQDLEQLDEAAIAYARRNLVGIVAESVVEELEGGPQ